MRRASLLAGGILLIMLALPLLPGPGWLVIARTLTVLEGEFPWVGRLLDRLESWINRRRAAARLRGFVRHEAGLPRATLR